VIFLKDKDSHFFLFDDICVLNQNLLIIFMKIFMETLLVTGGAGFIGSNLADALLAQGYKVLAVDNLDDFYDPAIKRKNIAAAMSHPNYTFIYSDICNIDFVEKQIPADISAIIHLAAKAGVRNSILIPDSYECYNTDSLTSSLELAVRLNIKKIIFTSSSSVYGNSVQVPFRESQLDLNLLSPYAISKLKSEQIGKNFAEKYDISFISLRLFSVYGPRLRPDLMLYKIAQCLYNGSPLKIFGNGMIKRDFTYVDDVVNGIICSMDYPAGNFEIFNIGYGCPVSIIELIAPFEKNAGKKIRTEFGNAISGESDITWADNSKAKKLMDFQPKISLNEGIGCFLKWFDEYVNKNSLCAE